jgi:VWFA-related protein
VTPNTQSLLLTLSLIITFVSGAGRAQSQRPASQEPPLQLKTELIEIRAVVTDKRGTVIKNLTRDDFEITESGKQQTISFFSTESISSVSGAPGAIVDPRPSGSGKGLPRKAGLPREAGRTIVFLVDTLHLSQTSLLQLRPVLFSFLDERLSGRDLAAVLTTSGSLGIAGQLTNDKQVLRKATDRLWAAARPGSDSLFTPYLAARVEQEAPLALEVAMGIVRAEERFSDDPLLAATVRAMTTSRARQIVAEAGYKRRVTLLALKAIAERLAEMPGQRLIVMISDGFTMLSSSGTIDADELRSVTSRASRHGVVIYSVDAKGLTGMSLFSATANRFDPNPQSASALLSFINAGDRDLENGLSLIAKETGGEAFVNTNDLKGSLAKVLDDNSFYYAMSYYPPAGAAKNSFRSVKVRVKGHPDYRVRTQSGYFAADLATNRAVTTDPDRLLLEAMNSPLAAGAIEVAASADFFPLQADDKHASLSVFVGAGTLGFSRQGDRHITDLTLMIGVVNNNGSIDSITKGAIQISSSAQRWESERQGVYRYAKRLALKPGLYQVRVGVRDATTERIGTAAAWIEVPEVNAKRWVLSSLLTARSKSEIHHPQQGQDTPISQPNVRNGVNLFKASDSLIYFFRGFRTGFTEDDTARLSGRLQIVENDKVILSDEWRPLSSFVLNKEKDWIQFGGEIALTKLVPGTYKIRMLVRDRESGPVMTRESDFEITP